MEVSNLRMSKSKYLFKSRRKKEWKWFKGKKKVTIRTPEELIPLSNDFKDFLTPESVTIPC